VFTHFELLHAILFFSLLIGVTDSLFGYTPWKTRDGGKVGYFALKYREFKNGKIKLVKSVRFGKRKTAKARATKWYNEYYRTT